MISSLSYLESGIEQLSTAIALFQGAYGNWSVIQANSRADADASIEVHAIFNL